MPAARDSRGRFVSAGGGAQGSSPVANIPGQGKLSGSFAQQIGGFSANTQKRLQSIRKGVTIKLFGAVIRDSPVDTGRFRANWQMTTENPAASANPEDYDPSGAESIKKMTDGVLQSGGDKPVFLTNNLPYAEPLEHGHSKQAPEGMVRKNIVRFNGLIKVAAEQNNISTT